MSFRSIKKLPCRISVIGMATSMQYVHAAKIRPMTSVSDQALRSKDKASQAPVENSFKTMVSDETKKMLASTNEKNDLKCLDSREKTAIKEAFGACVAPHDEERVNLFSYSSSSVTITKDTDISWTPLGAKEDVNRELFKSDSHSWVFVKLVYPSVLNKTPEPAGKGRKTLIQKEQEELILITKQAAGFNVERGNLYREATWNRSGLIGTNSQPSHSTVSGIKGEDIKRYLLVELREGSQKVEKTQREKAQAKFDESPLAPESMMPSESEFQSVFTEKDKKAIREAFGSCVNEGTNQKAKLYSYVAADVTNGTKEFQERHLATKDSLNTELFDGDDSSCVLVRVVLDPVFSTIQDENGYEREEMFLKEAMILITKVPGEYSFLGRLSCFNIQATARTQTATWNKSGTEGDSPISYGRGGFTNPSVDRKILKKVLLMQNLVPQESTNILSYVSSWFDY